MEKGGANPWHTHKLSFYTLLCALTYTFRKRIFMAWDKCERGAKRTILTVRTEEQRGNCVLISFHVTLYCTLAGWPTFQNIEHFRQSTLFFFSFRLKCHSPLSTTSHTSTLTTSSVAEKTHNRHFHYSCSWATEKNHSDILAVRGV